MHGPEIGAFKTYLDRIALFSGTSLSNYFVIGQAVGQPHFIQVSVGGAVGARVFQFDLPITGWSEVYAKKVEAEALRRGLAPYHVAGGPMNFLDVDFSDEAAHADFARWVITEAFGLPADTRFEVTSGAH